MPIKINKYNIYCDESCWMQFDDTHVIAWGALWCPYEKVVGFHEDLRAIKKNHGLSKDFEVKWKKVSPGKVEFYSEIINYFFKQDDLFFRGLLVPDKSILDHESFRQTHNEWYYKMYFDLLKVIINPNNRSNSCFNIYFDYKDTWQANRLRELNTVLINYLGNAKANIINNFHSVDSDEVGLIQLADIFTGAIAYTNRDLKTSDAKLQLIKSIQDLSTLSLRNTTPQGSTKFNLLVWQPNNRAQNGL